MPIAIIILILIIHWTADFVLQSDKESKGQSEDFNLLVRHTLKYSAVWFGALMFLSIITKTFVIGSFIFALKFVFITFLTHTAIDYYTSRVHKKLYMENKNHEFFTSIGFDQLLHYIQLFVTFMLLT